MAYVMTGAFGSCQFRTSSFGSAPEEGSGRIPGAALQPRLVDAGDLSGHPLGRGRLVLFGGRVNDQRLVRSAKTGVVDLYFVARGSRFLRADSRPASCIYAGQRPLSAAEADGNRTRLGALAPTPVLKTGGPTRCPDASVSEDNGEVPKGTHPAIHLPFPPVIRRRTGSWAGRRPPIP